MDSDSQKLDINSPYYDIHGMEYHVNCFKYYHALFRKSVKDTYDYKDYDIKLDKIVEWFSEKLKSANINKDDDNGARFNLVCKYFDQLD